MPSEEGELKSGIRILIYLILVVISVIMSLPFIWMILTSFKSLVEALAFPPTWIPREFRWQNYPEVLTRYAFVKYFVNTVFVAVCRTSTQVLICSFAAYAFARMRFPGRNVLFIIYLATLMIPIHVILIPNFMLMRFFSWVDTFYALIIPTIFGGGMVFGIFLLRQFFLTIPQDLVDASKLDGCSPLRTYVQIILPLAKPALVTFGVLSFLWSWNDFLWPLIITSSEDKWILSVALSILQGQYWSHIEYVMVGGVIAILPVIVIYVTAQRYIVKGITLTGMGGI